MRNLLKDVTAKFGGLTVFGGFVAAVLVTVTFMSLLAQRTSDRDLIGKLRSPDSEQRKKAAWSLGAEESNDSVPALTEALNDPNPDVRILAAWALGEIKDRRAVPGLLRALEDQDVLVREMVVRALGEMEDPRLLQRLSAVLQDPSPEVRAVAVWALGEIGTDRAFSTVRSARQDEDDYVRSMADRVALVRGSTLEMQEELVARDEEIGKQVDAVLRESSHAGDVTNLIANLGHDSPLVRIAAAFGLGRLGDDRAVDALIAAIRDPDPDVRAMVVWALDEINLQ